MKIAVLLENTACAGGIGAAHGLSLYLETPGHKLLFDMGPNAAFAENAQAMGVDLGAVDTAVLSHGHYDHAGGLDLFCRRNSAAGIYVQAAALAPCWSAGKGEPRYIGVPRSGLAHRDRFILCRGDRRIDGELFLFSSVTGEAFPTAANRTLLMEGPEGLVPDTFAHEQDLLVTAEGKAVLIAGCAHRGIVNILRRCEELLGRSPDYLFAGFHLHDPATGRPEPEALLRAVAEELAARPTRYFTGHCTGEAAYGVLKERLGDQLSHMGGGMTFAL